jgi:hypothetical protein
VDGLRHDRRGIAASAAAQRLDAGGVLAHQLMARAERERLLQREHAPLAARAGQIEQPDRAATRMHQVGARRQRQVVDHPVTARRAADLDCLVTKHALFDRCTVA